MLLFSQGSRAEIAVLLHGLLSSSGNWEESGAMHALQEMGWERAGRIRSGGPTGILLSTAQQPPRGNRHLYLADIPTLIPLEQQRDLLEQMLQRISSNYPEERLVLIAHSAGGVVSRMVVQQNNIQQLQALITVASPHLGSPYANWAYDLATLPFPLRLLPKLVAEEKYQLLRKSRPMIKGLSVAQPGTLLHWLNQQPHPPIHYLSITRQQPHSKQNQTLVPEWSQDMNRVPAIKGLGTTIPTRAPHSITMQDGYLIGSLLNHWITLPPHSYHSLYLNNRASN